MLIKGSHLLLVNSSLSWCFQPHFAWLGVSSVYVSHDKDGWIRCSQALVQESLLTKSKPNAHSVFYVYSAWPVFSVWSCKNLLDIKCDLPWPLVCIHITVCVLAWVSWCKYWNPSKYWYQSWKIFLSPAVLEVKITPECDFSNALTHLLAH